MNLQIRDATPTDAAGIGRLLQTVQSLHVVFDPSMYRPLDGAATLEEVSRLLSDGALRIRLAVWGGAVAGYAALRSGARESTVIVYPRRYLLLEHFAVLPEFRRRGIATALLKDFRGCALRAGIDEIRLDVRAENAEARACFEKAGFTVYHLKMRAAA